MLVGLGFMICEGWIVSEDQRLGVIGRGLCCLGFWNLGFVFFGCGKTLVCVVWGCSSFVWFLIFCALFVILV